MDSHWNDTFFAEGNSSAQLLGLSTEAPSPLDAALPYVNFMTGSRFWIQRVFVPIIVFIGVLGNVATIAVLTRRRMRSSTNVYLTALAVSDLLYLVFVFSLSLKHYPKLPEPFNQLYCQYMRFGFWLTDAASSTSVWLTVSFTVERYIAVCHPMRGKMLCTESRARRVTALVYALCFLATATTPFEWETKVRPGGVALTTPRSTDNDTSSLLHADEFPVVENGSFLIVPMDDYETTSTTEPPTLEYTLSSSELGRDKTYRAIFYWFTSVTFVFLPLILLFVFNSFLIHAVHTSRKRRFKMTQGEQLESSQNQENKITITLIAVVILFVVCQLPTASILIYESFAPKGAPSPAKDALILGLGNIFNFLVAINAASNFLLYCALSGKYRRTFVRTFAPCWAKRWRYFQSTRRRTSIRERSTSEGSSSALVRRRVRRKGKDSYYLTSNSVDECRTTPRTSPTGPSLRAPVTAGPDLLSVPATDDHNGGVQPKLKRHSSAYVTRDKQVGRAGVEFFRTRSMVSHGKKASFQDTASLPSASSTTPSSSITREDSALLAATSVNTTAASTANGNIASRRTGILSRLWHLKRMLWRSSELSSPSSAAVRITVTSHETESGARTTV